MPYAKLLKKIEIQYELNVPTQDLLQEVFTIEPVEKDITLK
jgi:hypothetical protein